MDRRNTALERPLEWYRRICVLGALLAGLGAHASGRQATADENLLSDLSNPILVEREKVFREIEGVKLKADLFRPADDKPHPLVMMVHGGAWTAGDKWDLLDHGREMAQAGFVAIAINYRLAPSSNIEQQLDDCRFAMKWVIQEADQWNANAERFGLWGYSAGAHLVSLLALDRKDGDPKIGAVVAGGPPCEFSFIADNSPLLKHVMGGTRAEIPDVYRRLSPVEYANPFAPPFFIFHGSQDWLVPSSSSKMLHDKLKGLGTDVEYVSVDDKGHLLTFLDLPTRRTAIEFLKKRLGEVD